MSIIGSNILAGSAGQGGGYTIERSLRLRSSASAYLNRTSGTPTSGSIFTHSFWVKRGILGTQQTLISGQRPTNFDRIYFDSNNTLFYQWNDGASNLLYLQPTQVFRDPSAWYHIVVSTDTTQATASNRVKFYINGVQVTALTSTTYPTQNSTSYLNRNSTTLNLGRTTTAAFYLDGYLTEVNFIDGQALTPSDFGNYNEDTGVWQPAKYTGSYGTNGFYLNFSDNTNTTTLAADASGNGNDWTPNNISLTAGVTYDSMTDTPTIYADGGNYAVLNPLDKHASLPSPTNANLLLSNAGSAWFAIRSTIAVSGGKWYAEITQTGSNSFAGVMSGSSALSFGSYTASTGIYAFFNNGAGTTGYPYSNGTSGSSFTIASGDLIGLAYDYDAQTLEIYRNGSLQATVSSIPKTEPMLFCAAFAQTSATQNWNFGQRPFAYTPPAGFLPLHTGNLPDSAIVDGSEYFNAITYTGTGATVARTGVGFQPDLVWYKSRSVTENHSLFDVVRGVQQNLYSNLTNAEATDPGVYSFDSDGFTAYNSAYTFVAWNWKANGAGVSNTDGSITSTVSANPTAGFSIVTYTGNATNGATVGHGLGVSPSMIIGKIRSTTGDWYVWQTAMGDNLMRLNTTAAQIASTGNGVYNTGSFSSTVFALGSGSSMNTPTASPKSPAIPSSEATRAMVVLTGLLCIWGLGQRSSLPNVVTRQAAGI
jgi:hypothetical protein